MDALEEIISYGHIENKLMYPHKNPGMELVLVEQGRLEWGVNGVAEILLPGTIFFTLPWQTHGSMQIREPRNRIFFVLFKLNELSSPKKECVGMPDALGFSTKENEQLSSIFQHATHHAYKATPLLKALFPELIQRLSAKETLDASTARSILHTLILELARVIDSGSSGESFSAARLRVRNFLQHLQTTLDTPWTLDEMAERCGFKRTYFSQLVHELTGYPPLQYLSRIRFEHACHLLADPARSITEIAFESGYASSQYFAEAFKRQARITPTQYRQHLAQLQKVLEVNWKNPEVRSVFDEQRRKNNLGLS